MDTFIGSLIIIAIVLVILLAVSAYFPYYPEGIPDDIRIIHKFTAGNIGFADNYVSRTQDFGDFGVGVPQQQNLQHVSNLEVAANVFGGTAEEFDIEVPQHVIDYMKGGSLSFRIYETNQYGNLVIIWNGAELYNKKAGTGDIEVEIDPGQIKADNTLRIYAQGPGLFFWASTVYKISSFDVIAEYGPAKFLDFSVSQDELESMDRFDLSWFTASRSGTLVIKVNGEEIYSASPQRQDSVTFKDTDLMTASVSPGQNRLTFMAINGSFQLQDVVMLTYVSKDQRAIRERFDLKQPQLDKLKAQGGVVRIYVDDIEKAGDLTVKMNEQSIGSAPAKDGWNTVRFEGSVMQLDTNWVEISGTGTFDVSDVSIELA